MNTENTKASRLELDKARVTEEEAAHAISGGYVDMAPNRLYYPAYHDVKSVLLIDGVITKSHKGAQHQFRVRLVLPGTFPEEDAQLIAHLWKDRQRADYGYYIDADIPGLRRDAKVVSEFGARCGAYVARVARVGGVRATTP